MSDNQGSMALAKNPTNHHSYKHINVQHHFMTQNVKKIVELEYCPMQYMITDIVTKALARDWYEFFNKGIELEYNATLQSGSVGR